MGSVFSYVTSKLIRYHINAKRNFSMLQFVVSPRIGSLSDKYGRKKVLLITMIGNLLSAIVYVSIPTLPAAAERVPSTGGSNPLHSRRTCYHESSEA